VPKSILWFAPAFLLAAGSQAPARAQEKRVFEFEIFGGPSFAGERTCATPATSG
jgi:hypothetical protein